MLGLFQPQIKIQCILVSIVESITHKGEKQQNIAVESAASSASWPTSQLCYFREYSPLLSILFSPPLHPTRTSLTIPNCGWFVLGFFAPIFFFNPIHFCNNADLELPWASSVDNHPLNLSTWCSESRTYQLLHFSLFLQILGRLGVWADIFQHHPDIWSGLVSSHRWDCLLS